MRLASSIEMRALEEKAAQSGFLSEEALMDRAAKHLADALQNENAENTVILCGPGNNGADGYTLAQLLREQKNAPAAVIALAQPKSALCAARQRRFATLDAPLYSFAGERAICESLLKKADLIVDCVYGTGYDATRQPDPEFVSLCALIRDLPAKRVSADLPSGLDADRGTTAFDRKGEPVVIRADRTITFSYAKPALTTAPGTLFAGEWTIADLGIPQSIAEEILQSAFTIEKTVRSRIPARQSESSKSDYGSLLQFCGSDTMTGAAYLSACGALRTGVGLLRCCSTAHAVTVLQNRLSEPVFLPLPTTLEGALDAPRLKEEFARVLPKQTALLIGCGIGLDDDAARVTRYLIEQAPCPIVCDADAITLLSRDPEFLRKHGHKLVLTPHPGEAARLLDTTAKDVQAQRIRAAREISSRYFCVTVLKGNRTLVVSPDGKLAVNLSCGNPGMAKAGMGDLLAGILAGFLARGTDPFDAACLAVYLHARAGDLAAARLGEDAMLPSDALRYLPQAIREE